MFDDDSEFLPEIREQAALALEEASVALVIVDGQQGLTAADESIAEFLRSHRCPTLLAVNKCESPEQGLAMAGEFWGLGLGEPPSDLGHSRRRNRRTAGSGAHLFPPEGSGG